MYNIKFPESFSNLIFQLKDNFSRPSFKHFQVVLSAILLGHPKKTITSGLRLMQPSGHFSNSCRFLSHYKWDPIELGLSVLKITLKYLSVVSPLVFGLDDTVVGRAVFDTANIRFQNAAGTASLESLVQKKNGPWRRIFFRKSRVQGPIHFGRVRLNAGK